MGTTIQVRDFATREVMIIVNEKHPSVESILRFFVYEHLPEYLQAPSRMIADVAHRMADDLEGPELTAGLRKLLEAKDCFVRAALPEKKDETEIAK